MKLVALLFLLATGPAASAQDVIDVWELGDISACDSDDSGAGFGNCVSAVRDSVDAVLNSVYREALASAERGAGESPWLEDLPDVLRRSQRAWVALKEAECFEALQRMSAPGNGAGVNTAQCEIAKSRVRIAELRQYYLNDGFGPGSY